MYRIRSRQLARLEKKRRGPKRGLARSHRYKVVMKRLKRHAEDRSRRYKDAI